MVGFSVAEVTRCNFESSRVAAGRPEKIKSYQFLGFLGEIEYHIIRGKCII
jgi:hypothetical protein